jgi:anti-anti-sigma factor
VDGHHHIEPLQREERQAGGTVKWEARSVAQFPLLQKKGSSMPNGVVDGCGLQAGDHVCWVYGSDEEHRDVLTRFLKDGLERNERVLYLARRFTATTVMGYLQEAGIPAEDFLGSGQLVFLDAQAAYLGEDGFQPQRMGDAFRQAAAQAVADGYRGLRAASETEWLVPLFVNPARFVAYELWVDHIVASLPQIGLCGYDARYSRPEWLQALQAVHPHRITSRAVPQSPFTISSADQGEVVVRGEVDWRCREAFQLALTAAAACAPVKMVLDLDDLRFIDLSGLRALPGLARALRAEGRTLTLRSLSSVAKRVMHPSLGFELPPNLRLA